MAAHLRANVQKLLPAAAVPYPMLHRFPAPNSSLPEQFVVEVASELSREVLQSHAAAVNAILRLAMLGGMPMDLDATLNMVLDLAHEIVSYDRALVYLWEEDNEQVCLHLARGFADVRADNYQQGNVLNLWAGRVTRPMILTAGGDEQADDFLESIYSSSALVLPIISNNQVMGSLQLFSHEPQHFSSEHAQLLWILCLIAEHQISRSFTNQGLLRFAFTDYLTGLKTRGYFEQQLELEIKRAQRGRTPLSLLMIDIDLFKQFNDRHGHGAGDLLLREVAALLIKDMREIDTVARYGGEEFVIILPETGSAGATRVAERLRRNLERARSFPESPQAAAHVTISIGLAVFPEDAQLKGELMERTDAALYEAKRRGRNRVVLFSAMIDSPGRRTADLKKFPVAPKALRQKTGGSVAGHYRFK